MALFKIKISSIVILGFCVFGISSLTFSSDTYHKYKHFEIVENNGNKLEIKIHKLIPGKNDYFRKLVINGKEKDADIRPFNINSRFDNPIKYDIDDKFPDVAKCTFSFYKSDPCNTFPWPNPPIWEQDVFVLKPYTDGITKITIENLAKEYAPLPILAEGERYYPVSIDYLLNRDCEDHDTNISKIRMTLKSTGRRAWFFKRNTYTEPSYVWSKGQFERELLKPEITRNKNHHKITRRKLTNRPTIPFPDIDDIEFDNLDKVLPYNGDNRFLLDTISNNPFKKAFRKRGNRSSFSERHGKKENITIYYSYLPNTKENRVIINYHFFYTYDPKNENERVYFRKASHVFDRESISIVFDKDDVLEREENGKELEPLFTIFAGHLSTQTIAMAKDKSKKWSYRGWQNRQKWSGGRVRVYWCDVLKIDKHPVAFVAKGSHAIYPSLGDYDVSPTKYVYKIVDLIKIPLPWISRIITDHTGTGTIIVPKDVPYKTCKEKESIGMEVVNYQLMDLEIGNITSKSSNSILAFSGYFVDIVGAGSNARFPPFTGRETRIDEFINGNKEKGKKLYVWDNSKVTSNVCKKMSELKTDLEVIFDKKLTD